jgi:P4 family phage/plasmid primase-like protien
MSFFETIAIPLATERGWKVAPCFPKKKEVHTELVPRPLKMMSSDPLQIHTWAEKEPDANVCVYAQQVEGGLCFLDKDGPEDIRQAYQRATGKDFQTLFVRSSIQNGVEKGHWYFRQTDRTRNFEKNITEKDTEGWFSFRVKNEYVCSIGSIHPRTGEPYEVMEDYPIIPMPDDLLDWLQDQVKRKPRTREEAAERGKLKKGTRYTALISEAGRLWSRGYGRELTIKTGIEWARENFDVPEGAFNETIVREEIEHLIDSYPKGNPKPPSERITDADNADHLVAAEGKNLKYGFEMKKWLVWDGKRWQVDEKQYARVLMERTMRARVGQVVPTGTAKDVADASKCLDTYRITNGLHEAEKKLGVAAAELDAHPFLVTFENGTLDLETMTLGPHKREHLITKMIHHRYNPEADVPSRFLGLLEHAVGKEAMPYMQKLLGYSLTGDTSEKTFIVVWGEGDTGKTTCLEIARNLLEEYAVLLQVDTLMDRRGSDSAVQEDLVALRGTRIATTSELDQGRKLSIAVIKRIVQGQGKITASAKYEKKITFPETHKLWFDTNHLPMIPADEQAVWNRVAIVVFGNPVPKEKQDKKLVRSILREEPEGILAFMVEGERLRQKEGLGDVPVTFKLEKEKWQKKMDVIQQYVDERTERGSGLRERTDTVYEDFVTWIGNPEHPMTRRTFTQRLAKLGITLDKGRRYYEGLALVKEFANESL